MSSSASRPGSLAWWSATVGIGTGTAVLLLTPVGGLVWESPQVLFWFVTIAASLCVVGALGVLWLAHRRNIAELGLLGAGLMAVSVLPLVHGLTAPGVLYGPNEAVMSSVFFALPIAVFAMAPIVVPSAGIRRWVGDHWRGWAVGWATAATLLAGVLVVFPQSVAVPAPGHPLSVAVAGFGLAGSFALSRQQLRLYWIGERASTLVASIGFVLIGLTSLVWIGGPAFGIGWWAVHVIDVTGVFAGIFGLARSHRVGRPVMALVEPVATRDPLRTLELGLSPVVHRFVAALDAKDPITRDHVIRTAQLAVRVGEQLALEPRRLRFLGLGALLHDIGKLETPDEILNKPGRLTTDEFEIVKAHPIAGAEMLSRVPSLADAAPFVRSHHERIDGGGYPDGLRGGDIPLEARIISVCDAFDAMSNTRQYREGMGREKSVAILREHAGSQWDPSAVHAMVGLVTDHGQNAGEDQPRLDEVGRMAELCECVDALPEAVRSELTSQVVTTS